MRARAWLSLFAALAGCVPVVGCRQVAGLDGLVFADDGEGGGGGGGAGGDAGVAAVEDCTDGVDDDGDGDVDCADADCGAYACFAPPPGWSGPVALHEGPPDAAPGCPVLFSDLAFEGGSGLETPGDAACAPCACVSPVVSCSEASLRVYSKSSCVGVAIDWMDLAPGQCAPVREDGDGWKLATPEASGSCTPSGGEATVPPLKWSGARSLACGATALGGGCAGQGVCAPTEAPAPFQMGCIWRDGDHACPAGLQKHLVATFVDTRGCSACACGAVESATCAATAALFGAEGCAGDAIGSVASGTCAAANGVLSAKMDVVPGGDPSCPATGGQPTGSVAQDDGKTVCCPQ